MNPMTDFPRMMYQAGGPEQIHGGQFSTLIVYDPTELDVALAGGWHLSTPEAVAAAKTAPQMGALAFNADDSADDNAPPTRAELEQKARELGVEFTARLGDAKLAERIEAAMAQG